MVFMTILGNVVAATVMITVFTASGARLRRWLRLPVAPSSTLAADLVLGALLCGVWVLALGLTGILRPAAIVVGVVAQAAIGRWRRPGRVHGGFAVAIAAGLPNLLIAGDPPNFYDAMVYHLGLPWQALLQGAWHAHPENVFAAFPPLAELIATPPLAFGLFRAPALMHWWAWVSAAVVAGGLARRLGSSALVAHLVTAATMLLAVSPLVPGFPAAAGWFLAALLPAAGEALIGAHRRASLPTVTTLLGVALATRIQGLSWAAILIGLRLATTRGRGRLLQSGALFVLASAPWWLKNLILLHDPIAPVFWNRPGLETLWRDGAALARLGLGPADVIARLPHLLAPLTAVVVPTLIAATLGAALHRRNQGVLAAALLGIVAWTATGALPRFFVPVMVLLLVAAANCGRTALLRATSIVVVAGNLVLGFAIQSRWMPLVHPLDILGKNVVTAAPEVAPNPPFAAYRALDEILPADATVLLVSEPRVFLCPRPAVAPTNTIRLPSAA